MDDALHRRLTLVVAMLAGTLGALLGIAYLAWGSDVVIVAFVALCFSLSTWTALAWRRRGSLLAR
ncbi:hypothetical protein ACOZ4N_12935 [Halorientalis pallida]|uniref:hypothetical protein n=1 Tax=Halorientalis pallida TaxID=2479928 RepID=UPI003C7051EA